MYACSPVHEEGLNIFEKNMAYGCKFNKVVKNGNECISMSLAALKDCLIHVSVNENGGLSASSIVNGVSAEVLKIFVQTTSSWGIPRVKFIDVTARTVDGSIVTERKHNI